MLKNSKSQNLFIKKFRKVKINWSLCPILLLSAFLRFYSYDTRWGLAYDQAWFAVIARHALETFQLPFLGPFASGGPFQTGGEWFWIVMTGTILNPFSVISPWVFITILSIFQVYLLYILGKKYGGKSLSYITAILGAVSISQVLQATNLTNQMPSSLCASLFLLAVVLYLKKEKNIYLFLSGFAVGLSSSIHLQGVLLLIPLLCFIVITKSFNLKKLFFIGVGILIPWVPVLLIDIQNNFYNTKNMLMYLTNSQSKVSYDELGRRWLTFLTDYVPTSWGRIVGGNILFGYFEILLVGITFIVSIYKKLIGKRWVIVIVSTFLMTIALRYIRTPLYENYTTFIHPFVILLIAWSIWNVYKFNKYVAVIVLVIIVSFSTLSLWKDISNSTNYTNITTKQYVTFLKNKFPNEKFAIYDYNYITKQNTLPIVLYLQTEGLLDDNGRRIGMVIVANSTIKINPHKAIYGGNGGYQLVDLTASNSAALQKAKWAFVNPSIIYNSVEYWYKDK